MQMKILKYEIKYSEIQLNIKLLTLKKKFISFK